MGKEGAVENRMDAMYVQLFMCACRRMRGASRGALSVRNGPTSVCASLSLSVDLPMNRL